ncbi:hypothetical protein WJ528_10525, partial [Ralstonia solanacearum]
LIWLKADILVWPLQVGLRIIYLMLNKMVAADARSKTLAGTNASNEFNELQAGYVGLKTIPGSTLNAAV